MSMSIIAASRLRAVAPPFPSNGIIHRYFCNEISGTVSNDSVGAENGIIKSGVTLGVSGFESGDLAYGFDGNTNSYVSYNSFLGGSNNFTIYVRFKNNDLTDLKNEIFTGWLGSNSFLIRQVSSNNEVIPAFTTVTNNGRVNLNGISNTISSDWNEYIVTYNGSQMTMQTNLQAMQTFAQTGVLNTSSEYRLGQLNSSLTGKIDFDELIVWNRALTEEEQQATFITI